MRTLDINEDISLKVFPEKEGAPTFPRRVLFVVPHTATESDYVPLCKPPINLWRQPRICVLEASLYSLFIATEKGKIERRLDLGMIELKTFNTVSDRDAQNQADHYLGLLGLTEGDPVSVALVENNKGASLKETLVSLYNPFMDAFVAENRRNLRKLNAEATQIMEAKRDKISSGVVMEIDCENFPIILYRGPSRCSKMTQLGGVKKEAASTIVYRCVLS